MSYTTETLWIVNTRTCNFDCAYCYQGSHAWTWQTKIGLRKMMTGDLLDRALPWALDWAEKGLAVNWYGGEPLLNRALMEEAMPKWESAFKSREKMIRWSITTNGSLLDEGARFLLSKHNVGILLSLDGPPELHNQSRVYYGGKPSWHDIPTKEILQWRPQLEIAWQLDPRWDFTSDHLDWMIDYGFHRINFNINWLAEWPAEKRIRLEEFMRHVSRLCIQTRRNERPGRELYCNWMGKLDEAMIKDLKPVQPCGTGLHMLALTPEGWLYPSQEMAFSAVEPTRAPGTADYYRVGDLANLPVIDREKLNIVSSIKNAQMVLPKGFDCNNCVANPISFGGCHCRYIGQDGSDPSNRYQIMPGWCQSMQSALTGMIQGAVIERYMGLKLSSPDAGRQDFTAS